MTLKQALKNSKDKVARLETPGYTFLHDGEKLSFHSICKITGETRKESFIEEIRNRDDWQPEEFCY